MYQITECQCTHVMHQCDERKGCKMLKRIADNAFLSPPKMTDELKQLLYSVNGDAYLGEEKEKKLVATIRKQYK